MSEEISKKPKTKLSPSEWIEIETMWASGEYTLSQLAEKSGCHIQSLSRRFRNRGITKGSSGTVDAVRRTIQADMEDRAKNRLNKIEQRREFYDSTAVLIGQLTRKTVTDAVKSKLPLSSTEDDLKALQRASITLAKCFDTSSRSLGIEREDVGDDEIPDFFFGELTPEQVKKLRQAQTGELDEQEEQEREVTEQLEKEIASQITAERERLEEDEANQ